MTPRLPFRSALAFGSTITRNLWIKAIAEVAAKGARLLLWIAAARFLGKEQFGVYSFALAFGGIFATAADLGLQLHLAREVARGDDPPAATLTAAVRAKGLLTLGTLLLAAAVAFLYPRPLEVRLLLFLAIAALVAQTWTEFWNHWFRGLQRLDEEARLNLFHVTLGLAGGLAVLSMGRGAGALLLVLLAAALVTVVAAWARVSRTGGRLEPAPAGSARRALGRAAPIGIAILLSTVYFRIDQVMLERMRGDVEVGAYAAAYRLLEATLFLPALFMAALFPAFSEEAARPTGGREDLRALLAKALRWMVLTAALATAALVALAPLLLTGLYGGEYRDSAPLLRLLAPALLFVFPNYALTHMLVALRGQVDNAWIAGVCVPLNVGLNLWMIPPYGASGAAMATVITEACILVLASAAVRRRWARG